MARLPGDYCKYHVNCKIGVHCFSEPHYFCNMRMFLPLLLLFPINLIGQNLVYNPSFEKLAQAYKINYLKVENCDELYKIEKVFNYKQAFLIEVIINEELDVLPMIPANQSFEEIIL